MAENDVAVSLYAAHEKVYPREVDGRYQRLRNLAVIVLLGLYYLLPWIDWDGRQAVLFDLPARKFYIFWWVFWPQDFIYLSWLLIIAAMTLFFTTAVAGRLWCGYACPQTVWTELFIWLERWSEGSRNQQIKLDKSPWTWQKFRRKSLKQFLWISLAIWTGFTFVGYFTPVTELGSKLLTFKLGAWEVFWICFYGFATYGNAGFMREQVCKYMCPYARFQSAMFDADTLIISYDAERGEPRGKRKKTVNPIYEGLGDCVDCSQCVQVCPTGIDIRKGLQYECIACAACIDVCNQVMKKMNYPPNLIRYTTQNTDSRAHGSSKILRPRIIIYFFILLILVTGFLFSILNRTPLALDILRDRNALYQVVDGNLIENVYNLKLMNKDTRPHNYKVDVSGLPGIRTSNGSLEVPVDSGEVYNLPLRVRVDMNVIEKSANTIQITISSVDEKHTVTEPTRFLAPDPRNFQ